MEKIIECPSCKTKNPQEAHFCKMCGNPLSPEGIVLQKQLKISAQLEIINSLVKVVEDTQTLQLLKTYAQKLSK